MWGVILNPNVDGGIYQVFNTREEANSFADQWRGTFPEIRVVRA